MVSTNTLDHLLEVEARAAVMVSDAQSEADRRIRENEEKNRAHFDEKLKSETQKNQAQLKNEIEKIKNIYNKTLDDYRRELSLININEREFCSLLNSFLFCD
jgi:vacuolar-type H+-ATPase subunit H